MALTSSSSPYIGLFGTVIGIINSFQGLATVSQASLATVAPGLSEALIATAIGLFAAIPANIAYNRYSAMIDTQLASLASFSEELQAVLYGFSPEQGAPAAGGQEAGQEA